MGEGFNIASVLCPIPFHVNEIKKKCLNQRSNPLLQDDPSSFKHNDERHSRQSGDCVESGKEGDFQIIRVKVKFMDYAHNIHHLASSTKMLIASTDVWYYKVSLTVKVVQPLESLR